MVTRRCKKGCCSVEFCPLQLSFGMTGHTFQGQSAGPVDKNQPANAVDTIIVDPGTRMFEGNNPGMLYMLTSRATTMGSGNLDSAVYFSGPNMNRGRVLDLKYKQSLGPEKRPYKKVALREKWVRWLESRTLKPSYSDIQVEEVVQWCESFRMSRSDLDTALGRRGYWRKDMRTGVGH